MYACIRSHCISLHSAGHSEETSGKRVGDRDGNMCRDEREKKLSCGVLGHSPLLGNLLYTFPERGRL